MKSGWIIFTLFILNVALTAGVTMIMVSECGIAIEGNPVPRLFFGEFGLWGFPISASIGVLLTYLAIMAFKKLLNPKLASTLLLTVLLLSISDLIHDLHFLPTGNSLFTLPIPFLLTPVLVILSMYLFYRDIVSPLEF